MHVVVIADALSKKEFEAKPSNAHAIDYRERLSDVPQNADAVFILLPESKTSQGVPSFSSGTTVFINAVTGTLDHYKDQFVRINAWPGFLGRDVLEVAAPAEKVGQAEAVLTALGWNFVVVPDTPGMIAARIVASVINEAYFALGEEVSSREEIDQAMRLGTNYPFGPFEWARKIGLINIYNLLQVLASDNPAYEPAPALIKEI
ncbi:hypothetical protein EXU57_12215 [Segetibacter sp. 3557_3]|uniref:3-hydroxyacyl-CoA dehydrogenase family protein n=1 Tax=Segetibacter sp. 3557_3 TaxID=2547429 RepID=UPI00105902AE|nr:3-hydroxyacyl-CoA dehydrogenase family protein [Segetibacter sp. 3557_3]TDH26246.1 hypothetical protein EXU57_12215 [Segetibacter sp. 3557_3]